jgi:hypothetical protein
MNSKMLPVRYDVEIFREESGLWDRVAKLPIVWPVKNVGRDWFTLWPKQAVAIGDRETLATTRCKARELARSHWVASDGRVKVRIVEVKTNGAQLVIWQNGEWLDG